jgi:hypothetical protein
MDHGTGTAAAADTPEEQSPWDSTTPASATAAGAQLFVPNVPLGAIKQFALNGTRRINVKQLTTTHFFAD